MIFKSRDRAVRAEALLEAERAALAASAKLVAEYGLQVADLKSRLGELANRLSESTTISMKALAANQALEVKNAVLVERLDLVVNHGLGARTSAPRVQGPTAMPEEVEDGVYAYYQGDIDKAGLEQILRTSGYDSTDIEFELGDYPHHYAERQ